MFFEYGFLALCAIVLALLVYRYDMVDRERWTMLLLAVILGMAGCWFAGYAEDDLFLRFNFGIAQMAERAVVVAVFEEFIKLLPIVGIAILFRKQFNDPIDGLIYGAFVGLGFGLEESLFYLGLGGKSFGLVKMAHIPVRLLLHVLFGAIDGFGIGLARFPGRWRMWPLVLFLCLLTTIAIHALWDYLLCLHEAGRIADLLQRVLSIALLGSLTLVFGVLVVLGARWSREMFAPKSLKRIWGWPFSLWMQRGR